MERKLATVLFVDLVGSTALVASADPEVVRRRVTRYFAEADLCRGSRRHRGEVRATPSWLPSACRVGMEDDAERAIKAAFAILDQVHELGLAPGVGIESGEVVVDDAAQSTFVTGEAVNVAARLQQQAAPGEVLIGPSRGSPTNDARGRPGRARGPDRPDPRLAGCLRRRRLCSSSSVRAPPIGQSPLELPATPSTARSATAASPVHRLRRGRRRQEPARARVRDGLEGSTVLVGRCLPYGEGITHWPRPMVKTVAGISDDDPTKRRSRSSGPLRGRGRRRPRLASACWRRRRRALAAGDRLGCPPHREARRDAARRARLRGSTGPRSRSSS